MILIAITLLLYASGTDPEIHQGVAGSRGVQVGSFSYNEHQLPHAQQQNFKVRVWQCRPNLYVHCVKHILGMLNILFLGGSGAFLAPNANKF